MKITKRQLRRIIKEAMPRGGVPDVVGAVTGVPQGNIQNLVDEYKEWAIDYMGTPSGANSASVLATFIVDNGLDQGVSGENIVRDMARAMRFDSVDVRKEVTRQRAEYDAGGTLSDEESFERSFKESKVIKTTQKLLRRIIQEALTAPPETAEEWVYWGGGHNLSAEEDNDGQTVFYVETNHPDRSAIIDEAEQTADGVETDNDGQTVIYTGAYSQRDKAMAELKQRYGISSKTTEEFGSSPGGVWINAESDVPLTDDGAPLFDYYIDAHPYMFGVHPDFEAFVIDKLGFAPEWNDPGTLMLWKL